MGNRLSVGAEVTHEAEILQSPSMKDEAKAAGGYICHIIMFAVGLLFLGFWRRNN